MLLPEKTREIIVKSEELIYEICLTDGELM